MKTIELITKLYGIVALLWMRSLAWGAKSQWNKGAFTVGLIVLLSAAAIVHYQHSQHESRQAFDAQVSELTLGLENAKFKAAADAIDTCRRISIATLQKSARTCEIAISLYQEAFRGVASPLVADNVAKHEYDLMHMHIGRVLETNRVVAQYHAHKGNQSFIQRYPFAVVAFLFALAVAVLLPLTWLYAASKSVPLKPVPRRLNRRLIESRSKTHK